MAEPEPRTGSPLNLEAMWGLMAEVQRFGFDTARTVAERFTRMADSSLGTGDWTQMSPDRWLGAWRSMVAEATDDSTVQEFTAAANKMSEAFVQMWDVVWSTMTDSVGAGVGGIRSGGRIELSGAAGTTTAPGTAHVHTGSSPPAGGVDLATGSLDSSAGDTVDASAVSLDPGTIADPAANHDYPISVTVAIPRDTPAGAYHGYIFVRSEPESQIPVQLTVNEA